MSDRTQIPDAQARERALDPRQSFIVQAPAGSGKTGLLIQRYLKLLACVDAPEEVIAITFTRKAAAEMRERVLLALETARNSAVPDKAYEKRTYELAKAVLQRDEHFAWYVTDNPQRLRIQTIDSLCASIARQMPILSKFGAQLESTEDASELYLEAARQTIEMIESEDAIADDLTELLEHLDNDVARIELLLAEMLAGRDHWLRHIHGRTRDELEMALQNAQREALDHVSGLFSRSLQAELQALLHYAGANLGADSTASPIVECVDVESILDSREVVHWCGISELLQTEKAWRKQLTVKNGFPPGRTTSEKELCKSWKDRGIALIELLKPNHSLCQALIDVRGLPPSTYTDQQWQILGVITRLLPYAAGQLKLVFQMKGKVDFTEVAQGALLALGDPEMPTDLALALDYRIQHLLIDEFQDTSISQYQLIEKMIAGWVPGDGRSLFAVGDPMQSIYRFREAEVGLFLRARAEGIGDVTLQPLMLTANFRSQSGIVEWVNKAFAQIMPRVEDVATGAVSYAPSVATKGVGDTGAVKIYPFFNKDYAAEAKQVGEIILQSQQRNISETVAILVRNRGHLEKIVRHLKELGLRFRAIEIEGLRFKPVVQDLLMLTRALMHQADRLAWFSVLRAPWCGMTLDDMHVLIDQNLPSNSGDVGKNNKHDGTVWSLINNDICLGLLSTDGRNRIIKLRDVLEHCINNRHRGALHSVVETAWLALGGSACWYENQAGKTSTDIEDARVYLDYLANHEVAGDIPAFEVFEKGLAKLYALPDQMADDRLQIMTIHKAKGLEFDVVIVPGLGRLSRGNDKKLLKWMERARSQCQANKEESGLDLLLAPIQETGSDEDAIYTWLQKFDDNKANLEDQRLLYVASTRAKSNLHLLGCVDSAVNKDGVYEYKNPRVKTLLNKLWPIVQIDFLKAAEGMLATGDEGLQNAEEGAVSGIVLGQSICRLKSGWSLPVAPPSVQWCPPQDMAPSKHENIEFSWASETARHVGSVVHRWLQRVAEDELKGWNEKSIKQLRGKFKQGLVLSGMSVHDKAIDHAIERVTSALILTINDPRGRWLLGSQINAHNELRMSAKIKEKIVNVGIDRTFLAAEGGRWIVDYKTSHHVGGGVEDFLDREQSRYRKQLDQYAVIMQLKDRRPVRLGLYFPLLGGWREWGLKKDEANAVSE
ncbi:MAG: UvrD-helicase domain-containing protein [Nitrosomonas sp.]|nr:UvrD-helicase domain-containing protein [Nitrosomonas sp.]